MCSLGSESIIECIFQIYQSKIGLKILVLGMFLLALEDLSYIFDCTIRRIFYKCFLVGD